MLVGDKIRKMRHRTLAHKQLILRDREKEAINRYKVPLFCTAQLQMHEETVMCTKDLISH